MNRSGLHANSHSGDQVAGHEALSLGGHVPTADTELSGALGLAPPSTQNSFPYVGTPGNDTFTGTPGNDTFNMGQGGVDSVSGGAGTDDFRFGSTLTAADHIDGGTSPADNDTLDLDGNYTNGQVLGHPPYFHQVTFTSTTMVNVEDIFLIAGTGNAYALFFNAATVEAGQTLQVDAHALDSDNPVTIDGSAVAGDLYISTATEACTLKGGSGNDVFQPGFYSDGGFTAADSINGGSGNDLVILNGNYTDGQVLGHHPYYNQLTFTPTTMVNVDDLRLIGGGPGNGYTVFLNAATVTAGQVMTIDGTPLDSDNPMTVDGSAVAGSLVFLGGPGADTLTGGAGNDAIYGNSGKDTLAGSGGNDSLKGGADADKMNGGGGRDTFVYSAVGDSTSTKYDQITGFDAAKDTFDVWVAVNGINATVTTGHLSTATFEGDLATAIGAAQLAAHHAVLFTPSTGTLKNDTFLIVETNGTHAYQPGHDLVIQLTGETGTFTTGDFI